MQRVFTEDFGRHYRKGEVRDYPRSFWNDLAARAGRSLDEFTSDPADLILAGLGSAGEQQGDGGEAGAGHRSPPPSPKSRKR